MSNTGGDVHGNILASQLQLRAGRAMSEKVVAFTGWMITGLAALLALLLANLDKLQGFIHLPDLRLSIRIFVGLLVLHAFQRLIGAVIEAAVTANDKAQAFMQTDLGKKVLEGGLPDAFMSRYQAPFFPPFSWMIKRALSKVEGGQLDAPGRMVTLLAQCQAILTLLQVFGGVTAMWVVTRSV